MKLKKLVLALSLAVALVAGGCSKPKKQAAPLLNKAQVIATAQKSFKSGQSKQIVDLKTDTSRQVVATTFTFGGKPTVFHLNYQTQAKNKTQSLEEWVANTGNVYINGQSNWYKDSLNKVTGYSYADLLDSTMNNPMLMDPPARLVDSYKMTRKNRTYTLTARLTDRKTMQDAVEPILVTNVQSPQQAKVYRKLTKVGKWQDMTVKMVVKGKKLTTFSYTVNLKIGKLMKLSLGQNYGNFGSRDFLKLPTNVLNAKPLPQNNKQNKKK